MTRPGKRHVKKDTFASVVQQYLASPKFNNLAPSTRDSFSRYLSLAALPENLGALATNDIRTSDVQKYLDTLSDLSGRQLVTKKALQAAVKWAVVRDVLPYAITGGVELVTRDGGHKPWSDEQVVFVETFAPETISRVVTLGSNTGQRGSDIVRMRWSDFETHGGRRGINVTQQKTGRRLWVPLTIQLQAAVERWGGTNRKDDKPIVLKRGGAPVTRPELSCLWCHERDRNPKMASMVGYTLHGLRATAIVRLRRLGATESQISDMVGISIPMITHYCRFSNQITNALAAVELLDRNPM